MPKPLLEPHKITLMGGPIPRYEGKTGKFVALAKTPEVQALAVTTAYQLMDASSSGFSPASLVGSAIYIGLATFNISLDRSNEKLLLQDMLRTSNTSKTSCINQKPQEQKANKEAWRFVAGWMAKAIKKRVGGGVLVVACFAALASDPVSYLSVFAPSIVRELNSARRWHKVATGEWAVEEKPKPLKKPAKALSKLKTVPALT